MMGDVGVEAASAAASTPIASDHRHAIVNIAVRLMTVRWERVRVVWVHC